MYFKLLFFLSFLHLVTIIPNSHAQNAKYGIKGETAPSWNIPNWIDGEGKKTKLEIDDFKDKVIVMLCFQSWCPGCHSHGFPTLKYLVNKYKNQEDVAFVVVQTVFEGKRSNTEKKLRKTQKKYKLKIPFGHDTGKNESRDHSNIMYHYKTGGTPWFIIIDKKSKVVYNNYDLDIQSAQRIIKRAKKG